MSYTYKHTLYASYLAYITQAIVNNLSPLLFLTYQQTFNLSLSQISLLILCNFGFQTCVDFLSAYFVDRIGYRPCMIFAHLCSTIGLIGLGTFPYSFSNAYIGLIVAIILNALGGGLIEVLVSPIVDALPSKEKASAMSLLHAFYCWGHVLVVILSTCYFHFFGIERWYILPCLWALLPLLNSFFFSKVPLCTLSPIPESASSAPLCQKHLFWLFLLLMICSGASEQAMSQWASLFAEAGLKVSKTIGDLLGPLFFAFLMGLSRTLYGLKGSHLSLHQTLIGSSILCILSYLLAILAPYPLLALLGCGLCGFSVGILWPGTFSLSTSYFPNGGTTLFAYLALAGDIGCLSGPSLVGLASNHFTKLTDLLTHTIYKGQDFMEVHLKTGLGLALIFPLCILLIIFLLEHHILPQKDTY